MKNMGLEKTPQGSQRDRRRDNPHSWRLLKAVRSRLIYMACRHKRTPRYSLCRRSLPHWDQVYWAIPYGSPHNQPVDAHYPSQCDGRHPLFRSVAARKERALLGMDFCIFCLEYTHATLVILVQGAFKESTWLDQERDRSSQWIRLPSQRDSRTKANDSFLCRRNKSRNVHHP